MRFFGVDSRAGFTGVAIAQRYWTSHSSAEITVGSESLSHRSRLDHSLLAKPLSSTVRTEYQINSVFARPVGLIQYRLLIMHEVSENHSKVHLVPTSL